MNEIIRKISLTGIVPVIKINDAEKAVPLARALCDGGVPVAEITFRTQQAEEAIARVTRELPEMLVGAGTVLTAKQVDRAVDAGCKFIVSPGFNSKVVEHCIKKGIPVTPGCLTPGDIERALELGIDVVKFFPAEASGGIKMIKALSGPYSNVRFIPTGGIDAGNINEYLSFPKVLACGGSWMVPEDAIKEGDFKKITELAREAVKNVLGFKLAHVGINCENEEQSLQIAKIFSDMFGFDVIKGNSSNFADKAVEVMKEPYRGTHGHIAIKTNYIDRAVNYLTCRGYSFDSSTAKYDAGNNLKAIYLENELGGFGIHLVQ